MNSQNNCRAMPIRRCCIICTRKVTKRRGFGCKDATRKIRLEIAGTFKQAFQMFLEDTIAAIATPLGEGGLAVVRISGAQAFTVADKSFLPVGKNSVKPSTATSHTIHFGKVIRHGETVDEVLLTVLRSPRTVLDAINATPTPLSSAARVGPPKRQTRS